MIRFKNSIKKASRYIEMIEMSYISTCEIKKTLYKHYTTYLNNYG